MAIMATSEAQVATTSEAHRATKVHRATKALAETTLEVHRVTEARREDLREPLQMADVEIGLTTKAVPTIV